MGHLPRASSGCLASGFAFDHEGLAHAIAAQPATAIGLDAMGTASAAELVWTARILTDSGARVVLASP